MADIVEFTNEHGKTVWAAADSVAYRRSQKAAKAAKAPDVAATAGEVVAATSAEPEIESQAPAKTSPKAAKA